MLATAALVFAFTNNNYAAPPLAQPATEQAAPAGVELTIQSDPPRANVMADGQRVGTTPTVIDLDADESVDLLIEKRGYQTEEFSNYRAGNAANGELMVPLQRATIELEVSSPLAGGELTINGTSYGKLPADRARRIELTWPEKGLEMRIIHPDHADYVERIPAAALSEEMNFAPQKANFVPRAER